MLTPWFPISSPPVRPGVYNVSCQYENQSGAWYSYFDGEKFGWFGCDSDEAYSERTRRTTARVKSWRGLSEQP